MMESVNLPGGDEVGEVGSKVLGLKRGPAEGGGKRGQRQVTHSERQTNTQ